MMKKLLTLAASIAWSSTAFAVDLNVSIVSGACVPFAGPCAVDAEAGVPVDYEVWGELTVGANDGLALWGCDFAFTGGPLSQGGAPLDMSSFVRPEGITNPQGYGGTTGVIGRDGELVQAGGGGNTIGNYVENALFPVGDVVKFIAVNGSPELLMTGTLTAPLADDSYVLSGLNCFGNVIRAGELGEPFFATEPFGAGAMTDLTVNVSACQQAAEMDAAAADPTCEASLPRLRGNVIRLQFLDIIDLPELGKVQIRELLPAGAYGPDLSEYFDFSVEPGNVLRILEDGCREGTCNFGSPPLCVGGLDAGNICGAVFERGGFGLPGTWYGISNGVGGWCSAAPFEVTYAAVVGDVGPGIGDGFADFTDVNITYALRLEPVTDTSRCDINFDGFCDFTDVNFVYANRNASRPARPAGHGCLP